MSAIDDSAKDFTSTARTYSSSDACTDAERTSIFLSSQGSERVSPGTVTVRNGPVTIRLTPPSQHGQVSLERGSAHVSDRGYHTSAQLSSNLSLSLSLSQPFPLTSVSLTHLYVVLVLHMHTGSHNTHTHTHTHTLSL